MITIDSEKPSTPKIIFEVIREDEGLQTPDDYYPVFVFVPSLNRGALYVRAEGNDSQMIEQPEKYRKYVINGQGQLVMVQYDQPQVGVDIDDLPEDELTPSRLDLELFFAQNNIPVSKKLPHNIT